MATAGGCCPTAAHGAVQSPASLFSWPPLCRWSYLGLGEPLCFLAFGPLATCAFYLAQVPPALVGGLVGVGVDACLHRRGGG